MSKNLVGTNLCGGHNLAPTLCVEMGFTWTYPRNQDATVKLKSELISFKGDTGKQALKHICQRFFNFQPIFLKLSANASFFEAVCFFKRALLLSDQF